MKQYLDRDGLDILWGKILGRTQVDSDLSSTSINPVQNKVVTAALYEVYDSIQSVLDEDLDATFDDYTFPLILTVPDTLIYKKGETVDVIINWNLERNGSQIVPDNIYINNEEYPTDSNQITISDVSIDTVYNFTAIYRGNSISKAINVVFINPSYISIINDSLALQNIDEVDIVNGEEILNTSREYTYNTNLSFQRICYAYPKIYKELIDISDINGYSYKYSYDMKEMTVNGEIYYIYVMTDPVSIDDFKQVYK